jgi:hypothetical protein
VFNDDAEYAASRIVGSYLPLTEKRGLAYIAEIQRSKNTNSLAKAQILAIPPGARSGEYEAFNIKDFMFAVGTLGYVNSGYQGASYLVRIPIRRDYKQGLRSNQCAIQRNTQMLNLQGDWIANNVKAVSNCLNNVFPRLEEAIERVDEQNDDVAFCKMFALSSKYKLLYKGFNAGVLTKEDTLKLDPNFSFLEQELAKVVGNEKISI